LRRRLLRRAFDGLLYAVTRVVMGVLLLLPWSVSRQVARGMGVLGYLLDRASRKDTARYNLRMAFPSWDDAQVVRTLRRVYMHLSESLVDSYRFLHAAQHGRTGDLLECVGMERLSEVPKDRGIIFVTGHFGHWEVMGAAAGFIGHPVWTVGRRFRNEFMDGYVTRLREGTGQQMIDKHGAPGRMLRLLRRGDNVAFMIDQDVRRNGIFVDFMGRPASTTPAAARMALRTGAPIAFVVAERLDGQNRFRITLKDLVFVDGDGAADGEIHRITQRLTSDLEAVVREAPAKWLWLHRRWKTYPGKYTQQ